ncbi:MAG: hypothetical protein ACI8W8_004475 [Rhodothermales bacterium]|jgi:hypothetical protein
MAYQRILTRMRDAISDNQYLITLHAQEEMVDDNLFLDDLKRGILRGAIVERQIDQELGESKYVVYGPSLAGNEIGIVGKFGVSGKLVLITVYVL